MLKKLQTLNLSDCTGLLSLPDLIGNLVNLRSLTLSRCHELQQLPISFGNLSNLETLTLNECEFEELPKSLCDLAKLKSFTISRCCKLRRLPHSFNTLSSLEYLNVNGSSIEELPELSNLLKLRSLHLSSLSHIYKLPESFCKLHNLEFLDLSKCHELAELPKSSGNLSTLSSLDLSFCCMLYKLPKSFSDLTNLEHLNLSHCCNLQELPKPFGVHTKLKKLVLRGCTHIKRIAVTRKRFTDPAKFLEVFLCRKAAQHDGISSNFERLQHLNETVSELHVKHLENLDNSKVAKNADLCNKSSVISLKLKWSRSAGAVVDRAILKNLQPHKNLQHFALSGYRGDKFPRWLKNIDNSLPNLVQLKLHNRYCDHLPSLVKLRKLEILEIHNAPAIKKVRSCGNSENVPFQMLRRLSLHNLCSLEEWSIPLTPDNLSKLHQVEIVKCPHLQFKPALPRSWEISFVDSSYPLSSKSNGFEMLPVAQSVTWKVSISDSMCSDGWHALSQLNSLRRLELDSCEMYILPVGVRCLQSLVSIIVRRCYTLRLLPEWLVDLSSLKKIHIEECWSLKCLPRSMQRMTSLKLLTVKSCHSELRNYCRAMKEEELSACTLNIEEEENLGPYIKWIHDRYSYQYWINNESLSDDEANKTTLNFLEEDLELPR